MADLNPKTATLREVAEAYAKKSGRGKAFVTPTLQYFKDIADEPGSALRLFQKDEEGRTLLSKTFTSVPENAAIKAPMQNLRQVGLLLKENVGPDTPEYKLLPDKSPNTDLNNRIFGRAEPPKTEAQIAINPNRKVQSQFFSGVAKYLDDPATRPAALAIIFNLNTGLRPNAVLNLSMKEYMPDTGAVYIETDVGGTKGRPVNIPLNPVADSILQELLVDVKPGDFFFRNPNGKQVTTGNINKILRAVKVPNLMYDQATKTYYDSLHPEKGPGKTGSPLLRNVHSSIAIDIGIPQERTAYLQGRSLKAASKGSTGELATYQKAFPGNVGDLDRDFASQISSFWGQSATDAGFDVQSKIPMPETRITTQTAGYEGYFDLPVREEVPTTAKPQKTDDTVPESNPQARASLESKGFDAKGMADGINKFLGKGLKVGLTAVGGSAVYEAVRDPEGAGAAFARDTAMEAALLAAKAPAALATAATAIVDPSLGVPIQGQKEEMLGLSQDIEAQGTDPGPFAGQDFIPTPEVEETSTEQMSRIATQDAGFVQRNREPEANPAANQGFAPQP